MNPNDVINVLFAATTTIEKVSAVKALQDTLTTHKDIFITSNMPKLFTLLDSFLSSPHEDLLHQTLQLLLLLIAIKDAEIEMNFAKLVPTLVAKYIQPIV